MRFLIAFGAILCSSLMYTSTANAQDDSNVKYKDRTEIDFEGLDVAGELVKPQGALFSERKRASFNPLIKLRTDFKPEMSQSVNDVK